MPGDHSEYKQQLSAWVDDDVASAVEIRAIRERMTKSDVVRAAVAMYLDSDADGKGSLERIEAKLDAISAKLDAKG